LTKRTSSEESTKIQEVKGDDDDVRDMKKKKSAFNYDTIKNLLEKSN